MFGYFVRDIVFESVLLLIIELIIKCHGYCRSHHGGSSDISYFILSAKYLCAMIDQFAVMPKSFWFLAVDFVSLTSLLSHLHCSYQTSHVPLQVIGKC